MPAVAAGKQQMKPPQDPQLFQAPGPFFLISLHHEGISVAAQLRAFGKQEGGFRLISIRTRHHIHGLASTHICCTTTTVSALGSGEETGKQKELETFILLRCKGLCRRHTFTNASFKNRNQLWKIRLCLQWGCLQTFPKDQTFSSSRSQVSRGSHPAQVVHETNSELKPPTFRSPKYPSCCFKRRYLSNADSGANTEWSP